MIQTLRNFNYSNQQSKMLFEAKSGFIGSTLLGPLFIALVLKGIVPNALLVPWLLVSIILFLFRLNLSKKALEAIKHKDKNLVTIYLKHYLWLIFFNALLLGMSSFFVLLYADIVYTLFVVLGVLIIITGSLSTLTPIYHAVFIFITTTLSTFIFAFLLFGTMQLHILVLLTLLAYTAIVIPSSFHIFQQWQNNFLHTQELQEKNAVYQESIDNFQYLRNSALEAIVISDENHNILQANKAALNMFHFNNLEECIGTSIVNFISNNEDKKKVLIALSKEIAYPYELNLMRNDKTIFPTLIAGRNITTDGKKSRLTTIIDLSELKLKDQQMLHQSRLAQMGEMISMIAHQWRQPLSAIASRSLNLKLKIALKSFNLTTPEGIEEHNRYFTEELDAINKLVNTLSTTIDDFRNFYKPNNNRTNTTLEKVLKKSLNIIRPSLENDHIELDYFCEDSVEIFIHESEVMQVVLNIFKNSQENFKDKRIKEPKIKIHIENKTLSICDNGGGISEDILDKVFDPYFSTKTEKNGTGLGLYMSKTIVENHHHGKLEVKNSDEGVCFEIILD